MQDLVGYTASTHVLADLCQISFSTASAHADV